MSVLVFGASGQVGTHLGQLLPDAQFVTRQEADLGEPAAVEAIVMSADPGIIINAAAYTAVDGAETEPGLAWRANAEGPATLAAIATRLDVPLIHLSTDYVFDGAEHRAYGTQDPTRPLGIYGKSKLAGELAVSSLTEKHWILRASWVFSEHGANFVKTMLRLAASQPTLRVVSDQFGTPTYAGSFAATIVALMKLASEPNAPAWGTYHTVGGPTTTWCDFAREIVGRAHARGLIDRLPEVEPITTSDYPTAATRPMHAVLKPSQEFIDALGVELDWQADLDVMLERLALAT